MHTLYDSSYAEASWILQFLAAGCWFRALDQMNQMTRLALGDSRWVAGLNAAEVFGVMVLVQVRWALWAFPRAVAVLAGAEFIRYCVSSWGMRRHGLRGLSHDSRYTIQLAATAGIGVWLASSLEGCSVQPLWAFVCVAGGVRLIWSPELIPAAL